MLRVSLLGNVGADPELRYSQKGTAVTTFRVAVHQVRTSAEGERQESTEWFRVRAVGRLSEIAQRLTKGSRVVVAGRLEISRYQSREGEPRVGFDVWADEVVNVSGRLSAAGEGELEPGTPAEEERVAPPAVAAATSAGRPAAVAPVRPGANGARDRVPARSAAAPAEALDDLPF